MGSVCKAVQSWCNFNSKDRQSLINHTFVSFPHHSLQAALCAAMHLMRFTMPTSAPQGHLIMSYMTLMNLCYFMIPSTIQAILYVTHYYLIARNLFVSGCCLVCDIILLLAIHVLFYKTMLITFTMKSPICFLFLISTWTFMHQEKMS